MKNYVEYYCGVDILGFPIIVRHYFTPINIKLDKSK